MDKKSEILDKIGRRDGMTVPDGYFAAFVERMTEQLPERQAAVPQPRTLWGKLRPYVYMAAMFGGVWCMMKMFSLIGGGDPDLGNIERHPGVLTALSNDTFVNEYVLPDVDHYDMLEDLYESGVTFDEIFGEDAIEVNENPKDL